MEGIFWKLWGDKHGRRKAMIITIIGFAITTGLLPTWQMVGFMGPWIAVTMLSKGAELIPILLEINVIVGSIIILIGAKINSETKDVDITQ